ncbi:unnamed protein product [Wuchereria bancrofti]|uniref:Adenosine 3'-phospho 5'-phosphosulfate transporter 1 n=2 Tax=Wuchereria bancrofti TaxID=6293 RepID=A0A183XDM6_WUCBA|nr:unnamed protein product [Wuchereria bancrofti]
MIAFYLNDFWLMRFFVILLSYGTVSIPIILVVFYVRRRAAENGFQPTTLFYSFLRSFALGKPEYGLMISDSIKLTSVVSQKNLRDDSLHLILCFSCLQFTLILMGYIQERIMTQAYLSVVDDQLNKFENTQFLVFINRVFAVFLCAVYLILNWKREPPHVPPFYKHSFTSFSNTLSSWCQYEALKFVSFPTQTVCKASKVLPTMLMGFIVRGERYKCGECACTVMLAFGATLFVLSNNAKEHASNAVLSSDHVTIVSGICLMSGYLLFDAFTLNWQKKLFDVRPRVSRYQMMFGVNVFSMVLCFVTLIEEGTFLSSFHFLITHEGFARDIFLLSLSGALGQIVIYTTIERFGPVIFAVMMTLRQILSILLSVVAYDHPMSAWSIFSLLITFIAIFGTIYARRHHTLQTKH